MPEEVPVRYREKTVHVPVVPKRCSVPFVVDPLPPLSIISGDFLILPGEFRIFLTQATLLPRKKRDVKQEPASGAEPTLA